MAIVERIDGTIKGVVSTAKQPPLYDGAYQINPDDENSIVLSTAGTRMEDNLMINIVNQIMSDRDLPVPPEVNGDYSLHVEMTDNTPEYSWEIAETGSSELPDPPQRDGSYALIHNKFTNPPGMEPEVIDSYDWIDVGYYGLLLSPDLPEEDGSYNLTLTCEDDDVELAWAESNSGGTSLPEIPEAEEEYDGGHYMLGGYIGRNDEPVYYWKEGSNTIILDDDGIESFGQLNKPWNWINEHLGDSVVAIRAGGMNKTLIVTDCFIGNGGYFVAALGRDSDDTNFPSTPSYFYYRAPLNGSLPEWYDPNEPEEPEPV